MKRVILALLLVGVAGTGAWAMNTEDILALCQSGFEPDKIARIVDATGLDSPLTSADWVRLKTEGCGDDVVEALLDVLVPVDEEAEATSEEQPDHRDRDVNVYLSGDWGWNGWYGSLFWGYDPYWSIGWNSWDPWAGWCGTGRDPFWYDPWWYSYRHRHHYGGWYDPFYYSHTRYVGGYYSGGAYARQKAMRRAGHARTDYAVVKTAPATRRAVYASAQAKPYRAVAVTRVSSSGPTAYRKTAGAGSSGGLTARSKSTTAGTGFTTRSQAQRKATGSTGSQSSGSYAKRKTSGSTATGQTATPRTGARSKTTVKSQPGSSGTTPAPAPKAKKGSRSGSTPPPQGSSYSPGATPSHGESAAASRGSGASQGSGSLTPRPKK